MTPEILGQIARRPFERQIEIKDVPGKYVGPQIPIEGQVTIEVTRDRIYAELLNKDGWQSRMFRLLPPGTAVNALELVRPTSPGVLVRPEHRGYIVPDAHGWEAHRATHYGITHGMSNDLFRFMVDALIVEGPMSGQPVAATRQIYSRGSWSTTTMFQGHPLLVSSLSDDEANECEDYRSETLAVTTDYQMEEHDGEALWNMLNFVTGNTVRHLADEYYADDGQLIRTEYRFGSPARDVRRKFFHLFHGQPSAEGIGAITGGMYRLLRAEFPIEVIVQHLLASAGNTVDVEAQHLVLAIHTAIEAWNRFFGREVWIDQNAWKRDADRIRKEFIPEEFFTRVGPDMKRSIRNVLAHANRTTTGWRQTNFFEGLQLDVSDPDSVRILRLRNELLHNGHFLKRFDELSYEEQQQRFSDVERLRRLVLLVIFRLLGFAGDFMNPVNFQAEHVVAVPLPALIAPPVAKAEP